MQFYLTEKHSESVHISWPLADFTEGKLVTFLNSIKVELTVEYFCGVYAKTGIIITELLFT